MHVPCCCIQKELCQHVSRYTYRIPPVLFIRTHLFPNPARAGRSTSDGRAGRLRAALEAALELVEVALDLVGGDLDADCLVAHDASGDLLAVVRDEGDLPAARVLTVRIAL